MYGVGSAVGAGQQYGTGSGDPDMYHTAQLDSCFHYGTVPLDGDGDGHSYGVGYDAGPGLVRGHGQMIVQRRDMANAHEGSGKGNASGECSFFGDAYTDREALLRTDAGSGRGVAPGWGDIRAEGGFFMALIFGSGEGDACGHGDDDDGEPPDGKG